MSFILPVLGPVENIDVKLTMSISKTIVNNTGVDGSSSKYTYMRVLRLYFHDFISSINSNNGGKYRAVKKDKYLPIKI